MFELLSLPLALLIQLTHFNLMLLFAFLNLKIESRDGNFIAANEVRVFKLLVLIRICLLLELIEEGVTLLLKLSYFHVHQLSLVREVPVLLNQQRV